MPPPRCASARTPEEASKDQPRPTPLRGGRSAAARPRRVPRHRADARPARPVAARNPRAAPTASRSRRDSPLSQEFLTGRRTDYRSQSASSIPPDATILHRTQRRTLPATTPAAYNQPSARSRPTRRTWARCIRPPFSPHRRPLTSPLRTLRNAGEGLKRRPSPAPLPLPEYAGAFISILHQSLRSGRGSTAYNPPPHPTCVPCGRGGGLYAVPRPELAIARVEHRPVNIPPLPRWADGGICPLLYPFLPRPAGVRPPAAPAGALRGGAVWRPLLSGLFHPAASRLSLKFSLFFRLFPQNPLDRNNWTMVHFSP